MFDINSQPEWLSCWLLSQLLLLKRLMTFTCTLLHDIYVAEDMKHTVGVLMSQLPLFVCLVMKTGVYEYTMCNWPVIQWHNLTWAAQHFWDSSLINSNNLRFCLLSEWTIQSAHASSATSYDAGFLKCNQMKPRRCRKHQRRHALIFRFILVFCVTTRICLHA